MTIHSLKTSERHSFGEGIGLDSLEAMSATLPPQSCDADARRFPLRCCSRHLHHRWYVGVPALDPVKELRLDGAAHYAAHAMSLV